MAEREKAGAALLPLVALFAFAGCGDDSMTTGDSGADGRVDASSDGTMGDASLDSSLPDGGSLPAHCVSPDDADPTGTDRIADALGEATATIDDPTACRRTYTLTTTAALRDSEPENPRTVVEEDGWPTTRTGNTMFDALHALALAEVRANSVSSIRDYAFNDGAAVECDSGGCFETGRLWHYVWTRDTAYAMDLGLAAMDPARAASSLSFKLSERRGGGNLQVVQDTGTGGSYPVSSDRVSWALGAAATLAALSGTARDDFRDRAYQALRNTLEHDRQIVFDAADGLYRGEQSFLDWREQTYPEWTAGDVVHIGMSKALGTNLLHLRAMEITAELADELGDVASRDRYLGWADALRTAISERFWLEDEGLFSTYVTTALDPAPVRRFDLLASAFAVLFGVATDAQAAEVLARYPHYGPGAVVVFPQQQDTAIYHNRGEWPFVTAYWLRAAKRTGNAVVAERMVSALMRGAALNLSNMENFEAASGAPWVDEGGTSGPVVNSQRQLWSVAGYLSMVHHTIFGLEATGDGLEVAPFVTAAMRTGLFAGTDALVLNDFPYRGRTVTVVVHLPADAGAGVLSVESIQVDGASAPADGFVPDAMLPGEARIDVTLAPGTGSAGSVTEVSDADYRDVFGPKTPRITTVTAVAGGIELGLDRRGEAASDVTYRIYRDGEVVADALPGSTPSWVDTGASASADAAPCWVVETTFAGSGNHSQHSPPACFWGASYERITTIGADSMTAVGGTASTEHGRFHYGSWGDAGHSLTVPSYTATRSGTHLLQLTFGNGAGGVTTGITCAVKRIVVEDLSTSTIVAEGPVVMPHLGDWSRWEDSSFVRAELVAGRSYRITIRGDDDVVNMSAFAHFEQYTAGLGGRSGAFNRVNVADLKILAR